MGFPTKEELGSLDTYFLGSTPYVAGSDVDTGSLDTYFLGSVPYVAAGSAPASNDIIADFDQFEQQVSFNTFTTSQDVSADFDAFEQEVSFNEVEGEVHETIYADFSFNPYIKDLNAIGVGAFDYWAWMGGTFNFEGEIHTAITHWLDESWWIFQYRPEQYIPWEPPYPLIVPPYYYDEFSIAKDFDSDGYIAGIGRVFADIDVSYSEFEQQAIFNEFVAHIGVTINADFDQFEQQAIFNAFTTSQDVVANFDQFEQQVSFNEFIGTSGGAITVDFDQFEQVLTFSDFTGQVDTNADAVSFTQTTEFNTFDIDNDVVVEFSSFEQEAMFNDFTSHSDIVADFDKFEQQVEFVSFSVDKETLFALFEQNVQFYAFETPSVEDGYDIIITTASWERFLHDTTTGREVLTSYTSTSQRPIRHSVSTLVR